MRELRRQTSQALTAQDPPSPGGFFFAQRYIMKYSEALAATGGLSGPSKMPWWSWSISAHECETGSKLREVEGSTCASCYAMKGNYVFGNVKTAQARRLAASKADGWVDAFVFVLENLHRRGRMTRDVEMLEKINEIASRTPLIEHWLPTREFGIVKEFLEKGNTFASNLCVRLSTPMVGDHPRQKPYGLSYSTVDAKERREELSACVAPLQGNKCRDCSQCWNPNVNVDYGLH